MHEVSIVMLEDHAAHREALAMVLGTRGYQVVAQVATVDNAETALRTHQPTLLLTDLSLAGHDVLGELMRLRRASVLTRVLVYTANDSALAARTALEQGARGYVVKDTDMAGLLDAVGTVAKGGDFVPAALRQQMSELGEQHLRRDDLTPREWDVLSGIVDGHTHEQIGRKLFISPRTVDSVRQALGNKTGVQDRADLVDLHRRLSGR